MANNKKFCQVHHLFYEGIECPMCLKERVARLEKLYAEKEVINEEKEPTAEMLEALADKFNTRL
jgi:hypothetical protein